LVGYRARIQSDGRREVPLPLECRRASLYEREAIKAPHLRPVGIRLFLSDYDFDRTQLGATPGPIFHQPQAEGLARSGTLAAALNWLTSGRFSLTSHGPPGPIIAPVGAVEAVGIAREAKEGK
jgi:hypothetical protein